MTEDEKVLRADHAQTLVNNPLLKKTIAVIKQMIFEEWEEATDEAVRDELWRQQRAVTSFEGVLLGYIQTGEIARKQLLQQRNFKQRVKKEI